ncbi:MAG TPA: hypothetical protein VGK28_09665 [Candidatus Dormibacteraeota bacterium]
MSTRDMGAQTKPFGPAAAALVAAGAGSFALGVLTTLVEVNTSVKTALTYSKEVGPLSGKVIWASVVYFVTLGVLAAVLWRRNPPPQQIYWVTGILVGLGLILTFPLTWKLFGAE